MAILIANENGDWWQFQPGESLYILNTDELTDEQYRAIVTDWGDLDTMPDYPDKLEKCIWEHGEPVNTSKLFQDN